MERVKDEEEEEWICLTQCRYMKLTTYDFYPRFA
jgi:hypothetical protein